MPKACVDKLIKQGKSPEEAHKLCYPGQKMVGGRERNISKRKKKKGKPGIY